MIPKTVNTSHTNPRYDLFAGYIRKMDDREFAWAQVHYERAAMKWGNDESRTLRDLVRAETVRREQALRRAA